MRLLLSPLILQPAYFQRKAPPQTSAFSLQQLVALSVWEVRGWLTTAADVPGEKEQALKVRPDEIDVRELGGLKRSPAYLQTQ